LELRKLNNMKKMENKWRKFWQIYSWCYPIQGQTWMETKRIIQARKISFALKITSFWNLEGQCKHINLFQRWMIEFSMYETLKVINLVNGHEGY
jgi:hypothetical protein